VRTNRGGAKGLSWVCNNLCPRNQLGRTPRFSGHPGLGHGGELPPRMGHQRARGGTFAENRWARRKKVKWGPDKKSGGETKTKKNICSGGPRGAGGTRRLTVRGTAPPKTMVAWNCSSAEGWGELIPGAENGPGCWSRFLLSSFVFCGHKKPPCSQPWLDWGTEGNIHNRGTPGPPNQGSFSNEGSPFLAAKGALWKRSWLVLPARP